MSNRNFFLATFLTCASATAAPRTSPHTSNKEVIQPAAEEVEEGRAARIGEVLDRPNYGRTRGFVRSAYAQLERIEHKLELLEDRTQRSQEQWRTQRTFLETRLHLAGDQTAATAPLFQARMRRELDGLERDLDCALRRTSATTSSGPRVHRHP